jgi:DME family drug/metabolite transporter
MTVLLGEVAGLFAAVCWGMTSLIVRHEGRRVNVVVLNAMSVSMTAGYTLVGLVLLQVLGLHHVAFGPRPLLGVAYLLISVALSLVIGDTLYFLALQRIGVARAMPISTSEPLLTTLLAVLFLGEHVTPGLLGGVILVPAGLYLVTRPVRGRVILPGADVGTTRVGVALAVGAAVTWSLSTIWLRPALDQIDVLTASFLKTSFAALMVWLIAWRSGSWGDQQSTRRPHPVAALAAGTFSSASTVLFALAVHQAGAARAATLSATSSLYSVPLSARLLGERVTPTMLLGTLLTTIGVVLVVAF